ncbi:hypothetical protein SRABI27_03699 [Pedobacter sp. Bi27]|nr:hypothetical protein SRABI27_03699 [Pedobacter sp. Bi27]
MNLVIYYTIWNMENLMEKINDLYIPFKALMVYRAESNNSYYVESHDLDSKGVAINAHPLSVKESQSLAEALDSSQRQAENFLHHKGLMAGNVLQLETGRNGSAVWFTEMVKKELHFVKGLNIPDGMAYVPPMIWKADRKQLSVWAMDITGRPNERTPLYHAPFYNVYENGLVCFGNVKIEIPIDCSLSAFTGSWEHYFFGSSFSHLIGGEVPIRGILNDTWKRQIATGRKFPLIAMKKTGRNLAEVLL